MRSLLPEFAHFSCDSQSRQSRTQTLMKWLSAYFLRDFLWDRWEWNTSGVCFGIRRSAVRVRPLAVDIPIGCGLCIGPRYKIFSRLVQYPSSASLQSLCLLTPEHGFSAYFPCLFV